MGIDPSSNSSKPDLRRLSDLVRPFIWPLLLATFLMLLGTGIQLITTRLMGKVVDAAMLAPSLKRLDWIVLALLGLFGAGAMLGYAQGYLFGKTNIVLSTTLRNRLFRHLLRLGPEFYETKRVGELLSRMGSDLGVVQQTLTGAVPNGCRALLQFFGAIVILLMISVKLTLIALLMVPLVAISSKSFGRRMRALSQKQQEATAMTTATAEEILNGVRTVKTFGRESYESNRYETELQKLNEIQLHNLLIRSSLGRALGFAGSAVMVLVIWFGGQLMFKKEISAGDLFSFLLYMGSITGSVNTMGDLYTGYNTLVGASVRVFELFDTQPSIDDSVDALPLAQTKGHLIFQNVSFRYPQTEGRQALTEFQLEIQQGEIVGLVGPSGAGKSTIFALLYRFYDPTGGSVYIDGIDLKTVRLKDLREQIGIVPQDIFLFTGTVAENISYGRPDATPDEIEAAAVAAGADEFINELPCRYQEPVGPRGVKLSTGQRQRIAIARAFLKNPAILLLDEATSSLDSDSEEKVKQAISNLLRGRTTLVIAHRLATARLADRILVLEQGRIIGIGTHDTLYASNQVYRRYWQLQSMTVDTPKESVTVDTPKEGETIVPPLSPQQPVEFPSFEVDNPVA